MQKHLYNKGCWIKTLWKANSSCYLKEKHWCVYYLCSASFLLSFIFSLGTNAVLQQSCFSRPRGDKCQFSRWQTASLLMPGWEPLREFSLLKKQKNTTSYHTSCTSLLLNSWCRSQKSFRSPPQTAFLASVGFLHVPNICLKFLLTYKKEYTSFRKQESKSETYLYQNVLFSASS